jgi:hypothetical protein
MEDGCARFPCLEDPLSDSEQQQQQSILIIIWWQLYVGKNQSHAHNFRNIMQCKNGNRLFTWNPSPLRQNYH